MSAPAGCIVGLGDILLLMKSTLSPATPPRWWTSGAVLCVSPWSCSHVLLEAIPAALLGVVQSAVINSGALRAMEHLKNNCKD